MAIRSHDGDGDSDSESTTVGLFKWVGCGGEGRWDGMGWDGMRWDGMGWDEMGWDEGNKSGVKEIACARTCNMQDKRDEAV